MRMRIVRTEYDRVLECDVSSAPMCDVTYVALSAIQRYGSLGELLHTLYLDLLSDKYYTLIVLY